MTDRYLKQVIVMRKDLNMPAGKLATMVAHASLKFLVDRLQPSVTDEWLGGRRMDGWFSPEELRWLTELDPGLEEYGQQSMAKIVVFVASLGELFMVYHAAVQQNLTVGKVIDCGYSHNPPKTFVGFAIGPHWPEAFVGLTDHLKTR